MKLKKNKRKINFFFHIYNHIPSMEDCTKIISFSIFLTLVAAVICRFLSVLIDVLGVYMFSFKKKKIVYIYIDKNVRFDESIYINNLMVSTCTSRDQPKNKFKFQKKTPSYRTRIVSLFIYDNLLFVASTCFSKIDTFLFINF